MSLRLICEVEKAKVRKSAVVKPLCFVRLQLAMPGRQTSSICSREHAAVHAENGFWGKQMDFSGGG